MKNQLQVFQNEEFGSIRVLEIDGQPWFVGKDVAAVLGYSNVSKAVSAHVDDEDRIREMIPTAQNGKLVSRTYLINESGLYSLILSSKLPKARSFKRWVTSDVLPSIRRHGGYITDETVEKILESPAFAHNLFKSLVEERQKTAELQSHVAELVPKAAYYDLILQNRDAIPVSMIAKDYGMSAVFFNQLLYAMKVQYKMGGTWLLYQKYADQGYTVSRTYQAGRDKTVVHTYWTQKGRRFLYGLLKRCGIVPVSESGESGLF